MPLSNGKTARWDNQYETIFCVFLAALAYLWRENDDLIYPQILYLLVLLLGLNLAAGLLLRRWPAREWLPALIICANNATITAILAYSGGRESNLWVLYLLPVNTACLLLRGREVAWITAGAVVFLSAYHLFSSAASLASMSFELLLKCGVIVFAALTTHRLVQRSRTSEETLRAELEDAEKTLQGSEEKLRQSQKMEAVGRLAGGIAHDFNNLLTIILGYGDVWRESLRPEDPRYDDVEEMRKAALRASSLTRQLLAFSRKQVLQPEVLDLNAVMKDAQKLLGRLIGEDIRMTVTPCGGEARVKADRGCLEQVIINLVINARDAMPHGGGLAVEISTVRSDGTKPARHGAVAAGDYVALTVRDTGCGMSDDVLSHVFEPFFTTKEPDKGTGLGLSTVYGIIAQSGGSVSVRSKVGHGTEFTVYLPRVSGRTATARPPEAPPAPFAGAATLLLVEDDAPLRKLFKRVLTENDFTVLDAGDGEEALSVSRRHRGMIHLLLTDTVLPKMTGPELVARIKAEHPETTVLMMSGHTDHAVLRDGGLDSSAAFIHKPFTSEQLLRKIQAILSLSRPAAP